MKLDIQVETLLKTKRYQDLSLEEKGMVAEMMSRSEYEQFRLILCGNQRSLGNIHTQPSPKIKKHLMAAMRAKKRKERPVSTFFQNAANYRMPAWQAAAAIACFFFLTMMAREQIVSFEYPQGESLYVSAIDTVYETIYQTDTVFKEIEIALKGKKVNVSPSKSNFKFSANQKIIKEKDSLMEVANRRFGDIFLDADPLLADTTLPNYARKASIEDEFFVPKKIYGRSARDDRDLMQFLEEIN